MNRISRLLLVALCGSTLTVTAQNTPPVPTTPPLDDITVFANGPYSSIDLTAAFSDPDTAAVRLGTVLGDIDLALFKQEKPITVTNFLRYVDEGRYFKIDPTTHEEASSFVHRSVNNFVIQGGGFIGTVDASEPASALPTQVTTFPPIQNEPGISNTRGTIAMAKSPTDPNSATSQWFINLADNGGPPNNLNTQNGGFTVFGRVVRGLTVVDAIAAELRFNFGAPFDSIPLRDYTVADFNSNVRIKVPNLISLPRIAAIAPFTFTASSSDATIATAKISDSRVLVTGKKAGIANITVRATDFDGASITQRFAVTVVGAPSRLVNISTRVQVGPNESALIGGLIVRDGTEKRLMIRALGPSLVAGGVADALSDPVLELRNQAGALLATNDNWEDNANRAEIVDTGIAPTSPNEAVILTTLPSSSMGTAYTAIVRGAAGGSGVGLVEVYDLDSGPGSTQVNISTRGRVDLGENVMIGGFILGGSGSSKIAVRALGPSLASAGVTDPLNDPTLELRNGQGTLINSNNDWQTSPEAAELQMVGLAPSVPREAALINTLPAGPYTAIVSGTGDTPTGIALVEVYQLP